MENSALKKWQRFFGTGWTRELENFLISPAFDRIGEQIKEQQSREILIAPKQSEIFRAFKECPFERIHTVVLALAPYPEMIGKEFIADGLAFSARKSLETPMQLTKVFGAVDEEIYDNVGYHLGTSNDLSSWANQGILLLNCALTCELGENITGHINMWKPFISHVIKILNNNRDRLAFVLMGEWAQSYKDLLDNNSFAIYECPHPIEAIWNKGKWESNNVFSAVTAFHKIFNNIDIKW